MKPNNNLTSFCIRKIPNQPFNNKEIKKFSAKYGIVESIKDGGDLLFVNFSKITDLEACMEFFRINGFVVEPSKRNKAQNQSNQQQQKQQETRSKPRSSVSKENLSVLMNSSEVGKQNGIPSSNNSDKKEYGNSNLSTMKSVSLLFYFGNPQFNYHLSICSRMEIVFFASVKPRYFVKDAMIFIAP